MVGLVVIRFSGYCVAGSFVLVAGWVCDLVFLLICVFCVVSRLPGCLCCVVVLFSGCFCLGLGLVGCWCVWGGVVWWLCFVSASLFVFWGACGTVWL